VRGRGEESMQLRNLGLKIINNVKKIWHWDGVLTRDRDSLMDGQRGRTEASPFMPYFLRPAHMDLAANDVCRLTSAIGPVWIHRLELVLASLSSTSHKVSRHEG
jgi:hypothetical protein